MLLAIPHSIPWPDPAKDRGICKKNFNRIPDNYNGITQQHRKYNLLVIMACIFVDSKKTQPSVNIPKAIGVHSPSEKNPTKTPKSQTPKTPKTQIGTHKALLSILLFIHSRTLYKAVTPRHPVSAASCSYLREVSLKSQAGDNTQHQLEERTGDR